MKIKRHKIGRNSIKESFDNLNVGMAYFNDNGLPILVNHKMDQIIFEIMGRDLQYEAELSDSLGLLKDHLFFDKNGHVWKFERNHLEDLGAEYIAADVTAIYRDTQRLQEKNRQLRELNAAIEEIGKNYVSIAREEEILSMKMRIHSEMGKCGLDIQRYYQEGCPKEKKEGLIQKLRKAVSLLKGEVGKTDGEDSLTELMSTAEAVGAGIEIKGQMPKESDAVNLMVLSMRECLMNTIRHAGGNKLYVKVNENNETYFIDITNNGQQPETEIVEGGGLSSLRQKIERIGGKMIVTSFPEFCLSLSVPKNFGGVS